MFHFTNTCLPGEKCQDPDCSHRVYRVSRYYCTWCPGFKEVTPDNFDRKQFPDDRISVCKTLTGRCFSFQLEFPCSQQKNSWRLNPWTSPMATKMDLSRKTNA